MKMKHILWAGLLGALLSCGLASCNNDEDYYYVPYSYAIGDMVVEEGSDPYIQMDDKKTLFPSNGDRLPSYLKKNGQRVIVNFTFLDEHREGYDYYILVNDIDSVLVKNIIPITPETTDSIGNDPINVMGMWSSDKYLTLQFEMRGAGQEKHMINLVRDYSLASAPDSEGYLHLKFRHNRMNDLDVNHYLWGVASFRLDDIYAEFPDLKGLKIDVRTSHGNETYTCDFDDSSSDGNAGRSSSQTHEQNVAAMCVK